MSIDNPILIRNFIKCKATIFVNFRVTCFNNAVKEAYLEYSSNNLNAENSGDLCYSTENLYISWGF